MILRNPSVMPFGGGALRWFVPRDEPAQRGFRISTVGVAGHRVELHKTELAKWPFCTLSEFAGAPSGNKRILLVAPLSGHFAFILR